MRKVGTRTNDSKRFAGIDKGYNVKFGGLPETSKSAQKRLNK